MRLVIFAVLPGNAHLHFARGRKLDGIAGDVHENLPEPAGVAHRHHWNIRRDEEIKYQSLTMRRFRQKFDRRLDAAAKFKVMLFEFEFRGFDTRYIDNIVDDRK